jgi:hypothetical protein
MILIRAEELNGRAQELAGRRSTVANRVSDGNTAHGSSASIRPRQRRFARCIAIMRDSGQEFLFLFRYGKAGYIHKYPMMVWTHQLLCCETFILLSVFNVSLSIGDGK